jgi:hypothetical protein
VRGLTLSAFLCLAVAAYAVILGEALAPKVRLGLAVLSLAGAAAFQLQARRLP